MGVSEPQSNLINFDDIYAKLAKERILFLCEDIGADIATSLTAHLFWLDSLNSDLDITLCINSHGGSVSDGLLTIYDTMQYIKAPIKTICIGEAYSAAAIILASGTKGKRLAYPNSKIMIHTIQVSDIFGSTSDLEKESKMVKKLNQSLMEIIARYTGQSLKKVKRDCKEDLYMDAQEALDYGIIDEIIIPFKSIPELKK